MSCSKPTFEQRREDSGGAFSVWKRNGAHRGLLKLIVANDPQAVDVDARPAVPTMRNLQ